MLLLGQVLCSAPVHASGNDSTEVKTSANLETCRDLITQSAYSRAFDACRLALSKAQGDEALNLLLHLVTASHALQNGKEGHYLTQLKNHPLFAKHPLAQYEWHRKVGQKHYFEGDFETAKHHLSQAFTLAQKADDPLWLSKSHNDMGLVLFKLGDYPAALTHYQSSLALKEVHGTTYQVANTLNNLGRIHLETEDIDQSVDYYESALAHYLAYTQEPGFEERVFDNLAHLYEDLNRAYLAQGADDKAAYYGQAVIKHLSQSNNKAAHIRTLLNMAQWHNEQNNSAFFEQFLTAAKDLIDLHTPPDYMAQFHWLEAQYLAKNHEQEKALAAVELGLVHASSSPALNNQLRLLKAQISEHLDPKAALQAYKSYMAHRETFLQQTYDSDFKTIQHTIERQKINHDLIEEQLLNAQHSERINRMTIWVLGTSLALLLVLTYLLVYHIRKKKEKEQLLQNILHHKQQLQLMEATQKPEENNETSGGKAQLKEHLVAAMLDAVMVWETTTQSSQIELAEQSKVWTVTIDNGTLRTRSLDKYLSLEKIPQNPRWRNVIKTIHFILSQDGLDKNDRDKLEQHIERIMPCVK